MRNECLNVLKKIAGQGSDQHSLILDSFYDQFAKSCDALPIVIEQKIQVNMNRTLQTLIQLAKLTKASLFQFVQSRIRNLYLKVRECVKRQEDYSQATAVYGWTLLSTVELLVELVDF